MTPPRRIARFRLAAVGALLLAPVARGHADPPVLHEFVPNLAERGTGTLVSAPGGRPEALVYDGALLPEPTLRPPAPDDPGMRAEPGDGHGLEERGQRSPSFRPDRVTSYDGNVVYDEVFSPSISPFKRVSALDAVVESNGVPVLGVASPATRVVPVVGADAAPPDDRPRDRFWGDVVLDFTSGGRVPFPVVSPESRVLSLQTEPPVSIRIERDGADNFYATSAARTRVRAVFLMDAPQSYFGTRMPEIASDLLADRLFAMPDGLRRRALGFARDLGVAPGDSIAHVLSVLTRHFRSFVESTERPADSGDIYLDLARSGRGVCRHRAYAFTITAQALGVPTRFVQNEAHAWVEVEIPTIGWIRIDLGGAARAIEPRGDAPAPPYRPREADPFPQPPAYRAALAEALRQSRLAGSSGASASGAGTGVVPGPAANGASSAAAPHVTASGLTVRLDRTRYEVFRGHSLDVSGTVQRAGGGAAGVRVEASLVGPSTVRLGATVTRENGWFTASFGVPPDLPVGDYALSLRVGDDDVRP